MRIKCMPMKVAIAALILGWSMSALAADVDVPYVKAPALPSYNWAGFYLGANLGGGFASEAASTPLGGVSINPGGVVGGVQLGYNFLLSPSWLLGIEGEFDWTSVQNTAIMTNPVATPTFDSDQNWYSTAGGRLGLVEGPWLYYFKGGAAWMNANYRVTNGVASDDVVSSRV
jgi:opacity protein-like surface antigen